jgi:hypothetical protein
MSPANYLSPLEDISDQVLRRIFRSNKVKVTGWKEVGNVA